MNKIFRATCISVLGLAAASGGFLACSSTSATNNDGGTTGDGGPGGEGGGGDGGGGGDSAGGDGGTATRNIGRITLDQTNLSGSYDYNASVSFNRTMLKGTPVPCPEMLNMTAGACMASKLCIPPAMDAGMPKFPDSLNAGTITIAGGSGDAGALPIAYGPQTIGPYMFNGYARPTGTTQFFAGGDMLTATGAGGADLPAIPTQTVVAPNDLTLTAPACAGSCPPVDRTMDIVGTWTGGGAGKVFFAYESLSDKFSVAVTCSFDASAGTGTVPATLLAHLEKAGDPNIGGAIVIGVTNQTPTFMVGDIPTTFEVLGGGGISSTLVVSQ